jgi:tetratricopeptide (TPR) repeat protein
MGERPQVFISHASEDLALALTFRDAIESAGVRCWMAPRDIPVGVSYAAALLEGIDDCPVFLLVYSVYSNASPNVAMEVERAASSGKSIFLVRTDATNPHDNKDMTLYVSRHQWFDGVGAEASSYLRNLVAAVQALVDGKGAPASAVAHDDLGGLAEIDAVRAFEWAGAWDRAEERYRALKQSTNAHVRCAAEIRLARCLIETCDRGDTAEAEDLLEAAETALVSLRDEGQRGELLLQQGRLADLDAKLRQALEKYEAARATLSGAGADLTEIDLVLASAERRRGEFNRALQRIEGMSPQEMTPGLRAWYYDELGATRLERGEAVAAVEALKQGLELDEAASAYASGSTRLLLAEAYQRVGRSNEALELIRNAMAIYRDADALRGLSEAKALLGQWHEDRGEYDDAIHWYHDALEDDRRSGDTDGMIRAKRRLASAYRKKGYTLRAEELVRDAYEDLGEGDDIGRASLLEEQGFLAIAAADYGKAIEHFDAALDVAKDDGNAWKIALAKRNLASAYRADDRYPEAEALLLEAKQTLEELGDLKELDDLLDDLGELMLEADRYAEARTFLEESLELDDRLGRVASKARSKLLLGRVLSRSSEQDKAGEEFEEAVALFDAAKIEVGKADALKQLGEWLLNQGQVERAEDHLQNALDIDNRLDRRVDRAQAKRLLAAVQRQRGNLDRAAEYLEHARRDLQRVDDPPEHAAIDLEEGRVRLAAGASIEARELLESAEHVFLRNGRPVDAASCRRFLGLAAGYEGRYAEALTLLDEAKRVFDSCGDVVELDELYDDLGTVHLLRGKTAEAETAVQQSIDVGRGSWRRGRGRSLTLLAKIAEKKGAWGEAKRYFEDALRVYEEIEDSVGQASVQVELGDWYAQCPPATRNLDEAVSRYKAARRLVQHHRNRRGVARCNRKLALVYIDRREYQRADEAIVDAVEELRGIDDLREWSAIYFAMGRLEAQRPPVPDHAKAIEWFERALVGFAQLGQDDKRTMTHRMLVTSHQALGNVKEALETIRQMEAERVAMYDVLVQDLFPSVATAASQTFASGAYGAAVDLAFASVERELKGRATAAGVTVSLSEGAAAHVRAWAEAVPVEATRFATREAVLAFAEFCAISFDVVRATAYDSSLTGASEAFAALSIASWIAHSSGASSNGSPAGAEQEGPVLAPAL